MLVGGTRQRLEIPKSERVLLPWFCWGQARPGAGIDRSAMKLRVRIDR